MKQRIYAAVLIVGMTLPLNAGEAQYRIAGRIYSTWNNVEWVELTTQLGGGMMGGLSAATMLHERAGEQLSRMLDELRATNPALFEYLTQKYGVSLNEPTR